MRQVEARYYPGSKGRVERESAELAQSRGWSLEGEPVTAIAAHGTGVRAALARDILPPILLLADGVHTEDDALRVAELAESGEHRIALYVSRTVQPSIEGLRLLASLLPPRTVAGRVQLGPVLLRLADSYADSAARALLPVARLGVST